jgi:hypothetical protein
MSNETGAMIILLALALWLIPRFLRWAGGGSGRGHGGRHGGGGGRYYQ